MENDMVCGHDDQAASGPVFTAQEEAALRHYSEARLRYEAMVSAGYVVGATNLVDYQTIMSQMGEILGKAEQMTLPQVAFSVGGDKVAFCGRLWQLCNSENDHAAIKAMVLMGRIHGMFDKADSKAPQVALVFAAARQPDANAKPVGLPFSMPAGSYEVFSEPNMVYNENDQEPK